MTVTSQSSVKWCTSNCLFCLISSPKAHKYSIYNDETRSRSSHLICSMIVTVGFVHNKSTKLLTDEMSVYSTGCFSASHRLFHMAPPHNKIVKHRRALRIIRLTTGILEATTAKWIPTGPLWTANTRDEDALACRMQRQPLCTLAIWPICCMHMFGTVSEY